MLSRHRPRRTLLGLATLVLAGCVPGVAADPNAPSDAVLTVQTTAESEVTGNQQEPLPWLFDLHVLRDGRRSWNRADDDQGDDDHGDDDQGDDDQGGGDVADGGVNDGSTGDGADDDPMLDPRCEQPPQSSIRAALLWSTMPQGIVDCYLAHGIDMFLIEENYCRFYEAQIYDVMDCHDAFPHPGYRLVAGAEIDLHGDPARPFSLADFCPPADRELNVGPNWREGRADVIVYEDTNGNGQLDLIPHNATAYVDNVLGISENFVSYREGEPANFALCNGTHRFVCPFMPPLGFSSTTRGPEPTLTSPGPLCIAHDENAIIEMKLGGESWDNEYNEWLRMPFE